MEVLEKMPLGELMRQPVSSLDPKDHKDEMFNYYSIPAYDEGAPIKELGEEIGSSKKVLEHGDVLISRIVPHIRRVWPVDENKKHTNIGSSEWIVFNTDKVIPEYLRYFLLSDVFHNQFMKTITGVGGSLMRANKKQTEKIKIPICSFEDQKAIVAKLDRAQRLIDIDREMLANYDEFIQSVFLEMFGDPVTNPKGWEVEKLGDLCGVGSSKRVYVKELVEEGIPFYRGQEIGKLSEGKALEPELFVTQDHYQQLIDHSGKPEIGDLLMPSICPDGRIFIVKNNKKFYFKDGRVLWVKAGQSDINSFYLRYHLKALFQANYSEIASGTTFAELKIFALKKLQILNPPIDLQERFQSEIERINQDIYRTKSSLKKSDDLFSSLVQGVFGK